MIHSFNEKLAFSLGEREKFDMNLLKKVIPNCVHVVKTDEETDKSGIDYVATLDGGATINIDAKTRKAGSKRYWGHGEPELVLERYSVCPEGENAGKIGWTLSRACNADMILYTFDPKDCRDFFLLPFQHLRMAFLKNGRDWAKEYEWKFERSDNWQSKAMFVPASVVLKAVSREMWGRVE